MAHVHIKICGVTQPADIEAAADLGADAVGINFYPKSPRYVDPQQAAPLLKAVPPMLVPVGLFVDQPLQQVYAQARQLAIRTVQWYGGEQELADPFPFALVLAFRIRDASSLLAVSNFLERCRHANTLPAAILVDAHVEGQMGGTGQVAPWDLLAEFRPGIPLILAGGLTPDNVAEAIRRVRPAGIDVASGVESSPGRKDVEKMRRFMDLAREVQ